MEHGLSGQTGPAVLQPAQESRIAIDSVSQVTICVVQALTQRQENVSTSTGTAGKVILGGSM